MSKETDDGFPLTRRLSSRQTEVVCRDVVEVVNDYIEDAMPSEARAAFEQHLHACPWCLTYLDQIRATSGFVRRLAQEELPPEVESSLRALFRARRTP